MDDLGVETGYGRWAASYEDGDNPLIRLEHDCLAMLRWGAPQRVLDVATGTGRHALAFGLEGADVLGLDASGQMLAVAEAKRARHGLSNVRFARAPIDAPLPVQATAFDLAICALALCHVQRLSEAVAFIAAAVRPGGHVVLTDLHPVAVSEGLVTLFEEDGQTHAIRTVAHTLEAYVGALASSGMEVVAVEERTLGDGLTTRPTNLPPGVRADWESLPFCLVVHGRKP